MTKITNQCSSTIYVFTPEGGLDRKKGQAVDTAYKVITITKKGSNQIISNVNLNGGNCCVTDDGVKIAGKMYPWKIQDYTYVGTMSGHTRATEIKDYATLAGTLANIIPGLGVATRVAIVLTSFIPKAVLPPDAYYTYELYQKGFMTKNWYQYSIVRLYEDKAHTKPMGKAWKSSPTHIPLPNS